MELLQMFGLEQTGILTGNSCVHLSVWRGLKLTEWYIHQFLEKNEWYTSSWKRMSDIPVLGKEWVIYQFLEENEWYTSSWKRMNDIPVLGKEWWYIPVLGREWVIYQFLEKNEWYTSSWKRMSDIPVLGKEWMVYQYLEKNDDIPVPGKEMCFQCERVAAMDCVLKAFTWWMNLLFFTSQPRLARFGLCCYTST